MRGRCPTSPVAVRRHSAVVDVLWYPVEVKVLVARDRTVLATQPLLAGEGAIQRWRVVGTAGCCERIKKLEELF